MAEQLTDGDWCGERQGGQVGLHGGVEGKPPLLHELQCGSGQERFGGAIDVGARVVGERCRTREVGAAETGLQHEVSIHRDGDSTAGSATRVQGLPCRFGQATPLLAHALTC
jgi:hypothetical protein